ncbi:MAG TPA: dienelactone hydrolase family protein [Bryobacteraceae bacterium]|nr:dienelactone hydrolase family protein [Bryobacteraceae bacterium]
MKTLEQERRVQINVAPGVLLEGNLGIPEDARGIVVFAHGSGSSRHSPRNRFVADYLRQGKIGTLLMDLLTPAEEQVDQRTMHLRFDIGLLAARLAGAAAWLNRNPDTAGRRIGYFGASTGAAAALVAAAHEPGGIAAIVSRGGRPDLAGPALGHVSAPTLLLVGGEDRPVITMNQEAYARLRGEKQIIIIPGATHLFEEPGALEEAARLARDWFARWLA